MEASLSVKTDPKYVGQLIELNTLENIPANWRNTPIESLIASQNLGLPIAIEQESVSPKLIVAACIDFRYSIPVPRMFAYIIRRASGRVVGSEFTLGYAMSKGVNYLALIGHNDCGMTKTQTAAPSITKALVNQGWSQALAEEYVKRSAERYKIKDEMESLRDEYDRLRKLFKKLVIAPLFVSLYDNRLYLPKWYVHETEHLKTDSEKVADADIKAIFPA